MTASEGDFSGRYVAGLDLEYDDIKNGFQVGKAAALSDWQAKREAKSFNRLIATLRATKWNKEHPERRREIAREHARRVSPAVAAKQKAKRHARKPDATVYRCASPRCIAEWCNVPDTIAGKGRGPRAAFCSDACRERTKYRVRAAAARALRAA